MGIESGFDLLEFGADVAAPYLANRDPGGGVSDVEPDKNIYFEIIDDDNDVDEAETTVHVRRDTGEPLVLAYDFVTGFQNGYTGSVVEDTTGGGQKYYKVTVIPPTDWDVRTTVTVGVVAKDVIGNTLNTSYGFDIITANVMAPFSWSFTTADETAPTIAAWAPTGTNIPVDQDVYFEVTDTMSGVDLATLDVTIHGTPAVVNGVAQPGYSLATPGILDGYAVTVGHPDLDPLEIINVAVDVDDVAGNPASQGWSYTTADTVAPVVSDNTPTGIDVSVLSDVVFKITDVGAGVDLANTTVTVGGILAYDGGAGGFQTDFQGPNSAVAVIAGGYQITIDAEDPYVGLTAYEVRVDSQDLQAPPNPMTTFVWSFTTEFVDLSAPIISNRDPAPDDTNVPVDTTLAFRLTDVSGLDESSVNMVVDGTQALINGVEGTGYALVKAPVVDGFDYVVTPDEVLLLDEEYELIVTASDTEGNDGSWVWTFTTVQGVIESPRLYARAIEETVSCIWTLPAPDVMRQTLFELRRSLSTFPLTPDEGELVYSGLDRQFVDTDVVYGQTYFYTIFVVRKYVDGLPVYVAYEEQASDSARPRQITVATSRQVEYVPARGDFGIRTVNPLPNGQVIATWGQKTAEGARQSDLIRTVAGRPVQSPVRGTVGAVADSVIESSDTRLKRVEISTQSGITLSLDGIVPWPDISPGSGVEAGQTLGRTSSGNVEFRIWKQPAGAFGRRAVRPRYFYLTTESRDGRL
jgi:hypothetical protein